MSVAKKSNKKIKKTVSIKQSVEYDGKKSEVVVSNSQKVNPDQKNEIKNDLLLEDSIITSLKMEDEINKKVDNVKEADKNIAPKSNSPDNAVIMKSNLNNNETNNQKIQKQSEKPEADNLNGLEATKERSMPLNKTPNKKEKKDNTNKILSIITAVCFICLAVVLGRFYVLNKSYTGTSLGNTKINGVNIAGLNNKQAETALANAFEEKAKTFELTLTYGDKNWTFDKDDFKVNSEIHTILEEAQIRERANGSYESQVNAVNKVTKKGKSLNVAFNYIFVGLEDKIDEIIKGINYDAEDSVLTFNPKAKEMFSITEDKAGLKVNKEQLYYEINEQFNMANKVKVEIPTLVIEPTVTSEYNKSLTGKLSSFSTNVSDSTGNRKANVKLALDRINGLTVQPGEEISFNKLTAPHSLANGYKVATIIFNGQFVDGVGGGVCQASTTLYNALLLADMEILQVSKHTLPVKYVPLGLDAMVAEGIADLKFKNNHKYPVFIKTSSNSESVAVEVYSHELEHGMTLKTKSEVIKKMAHNGDIIKQDTAQQYTDKVLYKGEQYRLSYPRNGFETKAYLEYYKDGNLVTQKQIRHEIYYPHQGVIIEGIEERPQEFKTIENNIEKIKAETQDTFMYTVMTGENFFDAIPTNYCP